MRTLIVGVFVSAALAAGLMWMAGSGENADAGPPSVAFAGVDMFGFDNACNSLGATDSVRGNVPLNQPFVIDVVVRGVPVGPGTDPSNPDGGGIYGTGFEFTWEPANALRVTGRSGGANNVLHLCSAGASPFETTDPTPDTDGSFRVDSTDLGGLVSGEEDGDGRLFSITVECLAQGTVNIDLTDSFTGGGDTLGVFGDSGSTLYTVAQEGTGQIGCDTDLGVTPPPTPTPCQTNCPTPTEPPGTQRLMGDLDCDAAVGAVDALKSLRFDADLPVTQTEPCPDPGADVIIDGSPQRWGDIDCDANYGAVDALKTLRHDADLPVSQTEPCPDPNADIIVAES